MEVFNMTIQETTRVQSFLEENKFNSVSNITAIVETDNTTSTDIVSESISFEQTIGFSQEESTAASVSASMALVVDQAALDLIEDVAIDSIVELETQENASTEEGVVELEAQDVPAEEAVVELEAQDVPAEEVVVELEAQENTPTEEVVVELETQDVPTEETIVELETQGMPAEGVVMELDVQDVAADETVVITDVLCGDNIPGLDAQGEEFVDTFSSTSIVDYVLGFFHNPFSSADIDDTSNIDIV